MFAFRPFRSKAFSVGTSKWWWRWWGWKLRFDSRERRREGGKRKREEKRISLKGWMGRFHFWVFFYCVLLLYLCLFLLWFYFAVLLLLLLLLLLDPLPTYTKKWMLIRKGPPPNKTFVSPTRRHRSVWCTNWKICRYRQWMLIFRKRHRNTFVVIRAAWSFWYQ